ncbi:hypothetical protein [Occallatibacter riparius]|uniref:Uncharacterized protein n=1 Tax=Occallatibacter riparius TaxID=1002689 RepID=A0A9J7BX95_9BACT|nr:hypothetical protein [Occallatibacter riparius]UWZ86498.1 hypothetical protein MOP44_11260 [Occallatibacter riparius]
MRRRFALAAAIAVPVWLAAVAGSRSAWAQNLTAPSVPVSMESLPDVPVPAGQEPGTPPPAQPQGDSSSQSGQTPVEQQPAVQTQSEREKAQQQIKEQEKQRVLGIVPMFNTSYVNDAVSLTAGEKIKLAFRTAIDPVSFAGPAVVAGLGEIDAPENNNGFGWGPGGYFKKWGAAYLDSFNGTMLGSGFFPALLRQDPRYFRLGRGSTMKRTMYSIATVAICKHDKTGKWEPNYSNIGGNFAAGGLATLYYPSGGERQGPEQVVSSALIVTATGALGSLFQEFWPDISRKMFKKDPTNGRDAQIRAAEEQKKTSGKEKQPIAPSPK